jgi:hypothetical protein
MISNVEWTYEPTTQRWGACVVGPPDRHLTIAWDGGDHALYLSVRVEATANVEGSSESVYSAPLSLLAATLLLPREEHGQLLEIVSAALVELRDMGIVANVQQVLANSIEPWPKPAVAGQRMQAAAETMPHVERLALDVAAAGAWG